MTVMQLLAQVMSRTHPLKSENFRPFEVWTADVQGQDYIRGSVADLKDADTTLDSLQGDPPKTSGCRYYLAQMS
ncbi:hypothetical protein Ancab_008806 [Ancistrocladus abbreviatus]